MTPQPHMLGTTSKEGKIPTLYEDLDTRDTIVRSYTVTDRDDVAQIQDVLDGESFGGGFSR
ncbi:hypothetical protein ACGFY7_45595 [Streptomyces prunicolor]|uniref:hypothetical protein n=1 Tax=Streptomyces prunicolor TaxID=67348 RepID=UPI0037143C11